MATQMHTLSGKLKWTQNLTKPDEFRGSKNYKVNLYDVDEAQWKNIGVQTRPKTDKEGHTLYLLKRPDSKVIKGELVNFGPIKVVDEDGNEIGSDTLIGNGTEATVEFITYDTEMGKGHRVEKVVINNLIEYIPQTEGAASNPTPAKGEIDKSIFED